MRLRKGAPGVSVIGRELRGCMDELFYKESSKKDVRPQM
jgi:hypothetical protein